MPIVWYQIRCNSPFHDFKYGTYHCYENLCLSLLLLNSAILIYRIYCFVHLSIYLSTLYSTHYTQILTLTDDEITHWWSLSCVILLGYAVTACLVSCRHPNAVIIKNKRLVTESYFLNMEILRSPLPKLMTWLVIAAVQNPPCIFI